MRMSKIAAVEAAGIIIASTVRAALVAASFVVFATLVGAEFPVIVSLASVLTLAATGLVVARYA